MEYENFDDSPLPLLKGRAKVKLAQQSTDFFDASPRGICSTADLPLNHTI